MSVLKRLQGILKRELEDRQAQFLTQDPWHQLARPSQKAPPGSWRIWLILAGRGFGKTRTGAQTIRQWVLGGQCQRVCLLGAHIHEARSVMVEGASGLRSISSPQDGLTYFPGKRELRWKNGAVAHIFSGAQPQQLRGPQFDGAWIDELAKFPDPQQAFDQLMFGLRMGRFPRIIITTTPKPSCFLNDLMNRADVVVTRGSTFENAANLSQGYLQDLQKTYQNTRLGAQEIEGALLSDTESALWKKDSFQYHNLSGQPLKCVIAVDPAVSSHGSSAETGIIVAARDHHGHGYIIQDLSGRYRAVEAVDKVAQAFHFYKAHWVIAEVNNGGQFIKDLFKIRAPTVRLKPVHAKVSKWTRAQPVAALYEQKRIFHAHCFAQLEEQLLRYTPDQKISPDRLDALVWALHDLFLEDGADDQKFRVWGVGSSAQLSDR